MAKMGITPKSPHAIRSVKEWKRVDNANVVSIHETFTTRAFGESSLIFLQDYHPLSKTLLTPTLVAGGRFQPKPPITEQIATALKLIHDNNLEARCVDVVKITLTDKNWICLNVCSVLEWFT
ncbi:hypothetical protein TrVGV298_002121 [Trichoderma virens]|nr:hypothetical protein TrVGV298_002121 [Trichoderma virens]